MQPLESSFSGFAGEGKGEVERGRKMGREEIESRKRRGVER